MEYYKKYMNNQAVSAEFHEKLLGLAERAPAKKTIRRWPQLAALAACCALIVGAGVWRLMPASPAVDPGPVTPATPVLTGPALVVEEGPDGPTQFVCIQGIGFAQVDGPSAVMDIAWPEGSFSVDLTPEQISAILWGNREDRPEDLVPWMLLWNGYTLRASALYDPSGALLQVTLTGENDRQDNFTITMAPEKLPMTCVLYGGGEVTDHRGVEVTGWTFQSDMDGDQETEEVCLCEFIAHDVGVRAKFVEQGEKGNWLISVFANWCTYYDRGLSLQHLLTAEQ